MKGNAEASKNVVRREMCLAGGSGARPVLAMAAGLDATIWGQLRDLRRQAFHNSSSVFVGRGTYGPKTCTMTYYNWYLSKAFVCGV